MKSEPRIIIKHKRWIGESTDCETGGLNFNGGDYYYLNDKIMYWDESIGCDSGGNGPINDESAILDAFHDYYLSMFSPRNYYNYNSNRVNMSEEDREHAIRTAIDEFALFRKKMLENELPSEFMNMVKIISIWFSELFGIPVNIKENIKIDEYPEFSRKYQDD